VPPDDPRDWVRDDVIAFAEEADPDEVGTVLRRLLAQPDECSLSVLVMFLGARHGATMLKPIPSQLATRALISLGPPGVAVLTEALLDEASDVHYPSSVLAALWRCGRGEGLVDVMEPRGGAELLDLSVPAGTQEAAARAVRDLFAEALVNPHVFFVVSQFVYQVGMRASFPTAAGGIDVEAADLMGLFAEASIKLSRSVLDAFAQLIADELPEERYQQFLAAHPVLMDPLAAEAVSKQRLGLELATDFALRSHDGRWTLVEIERPQDAIFTGKDDFRERFTHAFGQVLDFGSWVDENVAYAQRHMPGIVAPRGMLIMGLRSRLSGRQQTKLRRFADNSQRISVFTYDDLLAHSTSLYENLHHVRRQASAQEKTGSV